MTAKLTLGPVLFNWPADRWRDFHFRIADEAPVDTVHIGETVCSKRAPFLTDHIPAVIDRLQAAGKEVVLSSPSLVTAERERQAVQDLAATAELMVEANDMGCLALLSGRRHAVGPFVNVYNEATLQWVAGRGAVRFALPGELPGRAVAVLAGAAARVDAEVEVQVFGRLPLAISARCYHARAHDLHKDGCQFVCSQDDDGMTVTTLDGEPFLAVNGTQTMSHTFNALMAETAAMRAAGVTRFRLSPHSFDMVKAAGVWRALLDSRIDADEAGAVLRDLVSGAGLSNGFYHAREGVALTTATAE